MSLVEHKTLNEFSTNTNDKFFNQTFSASAKKYRTLEFIVVLSVSVK